MPASTMTYKIKFNSVSYVRYVSCIITCILSNLKLIITFKNIYNLYVYIYINIK